MRHKNKQSEFEIFLKSYFDLQKKVDDLLNFKGKNKNNVIVSRVIITLLMERKCSKSMNICFNISFEVSER
jgi:hypothetical protein